MTYFPRLGRILFIFFILIKYGVDNILLNTPLGKPFKFLLLFSPSQWSGQRKRPAAIRLRCALEELGPIFVKFGQLLSTRLDILPPDIAAELILLQDKVPPFASELAIKLVEDAIDMPIDQAFAQFDHVPLASASIAQVHAAVLKDSTQVVVKVLRPNIRLTISRDIALMETLANWAYRLVPEARRFRPREVVAEFKTTLLDELDLAREAANASQLKRNFKDSDILYVPEIHWPLTNINVLVMERIYGVSISQIDQFIATGTDLKCLAERGVEIFFTQVFRDCFFHADMHPGNILIDISNPKDPRYLALDFGIMGTLGPFDQRYLAENLLAFFKRNYRRVAELHVESGWVPATTRIEDFESAIRTVCEPIFARPLKDISFGGTLLRLFQTARRFNMEVQPQLILLQKTLLSVEGLGRQLYPQLDLWHTAQPYLEKWMVNQVGPKAFWNKFKERAPYWLEKFPDVPDYLYKTLQNKTQAKPYVPSRLPPPSQGAYLGFISGGLFMIGLGLIFIPSEVVSSHWLSHLAHRWHYYPEVGALLSLWSLKLCLQHNRRVRAFKAAYEPIA